MQLRISKSIEGGVYRVRLTLKDFSQADRDRFDKFDGPELDLGGSFAGDATFTLPVREVVLRDGYEMVEEFDIADSADAEDRANAWNTEIQSRLTAALAAWRAQNDTFTSDSTIEV